jgi:hypothetical protein
MAHKTATPNPILDGIRDLKATDLAINPLLSAANDKYQDEYRVANEAVMDIVRKRSAAFNEVFATRTAKFEALKKATRAALGLTEKQFEVLLGIFADGQFDFGEDIKDV